MNDAPQTEHGSDLAGLIAPVGRRVLGRHARLMRASGLRLGEAVAGRHETPEAAKAARRLAPVRLVTRAPAAAAAPAAAPAPAAPAPEASGTESTILPGVSDWAAEYLFGDADAALSTGQAWMGGAGLQPRTAEERRLSRIKRGGPEVARAAKILEGDEPAPAGPKRLARQPAPGVTSSPIRTTDNPTVPEPAPVAGESVARAAHETPASPPSEPAAGEPPRPTVARAAHETPASPRSMPAAGEPPRPTVARAAHETPASPPSEPAAGEPPRPTVARAAHETPASPRSAPAVGETPATTPPAGGEPPATSRPATGETARATSSESVAGTTPRPTVARVARGAPTAPPSGPAVGEPQATSEPAGAETAASPANVTDGAPARPGVARAPASAPSETAVGATRAPSLGAGPAAGAPARPTVARVAREPAVGEPRVPRAAAPARPAVQRVARPEPAVVAAAAPGPPATLLQRIADRFRAPTPQAPTTTPPRATVTRLARMDLQPTAAEAPVSETPAIRGTNPERLARMLGTEVTHDEQGNATVSMPEYVPFSTAPRTVSRVDADVPSSASEPASTTPSRPLEGAAPEAPAVDVDAIADTVIDKLRRELLVEREQAGGPMDLI